MTMSEPIDPGPHRAPARPGIASPNAMTTVLDLESLEPVAVEARYEVATTAARALEGTARLLVNRTVRGVPVMTRVRLDDPTLPQGIRTAARELAGSTRAKRLVLAIRAESGNAEDFAHAAEQSRRAGLEVALHGEPSAVLGHLRNTHGRLFLVAVSGDLGSGEVRQVASLAQRKGAAVLVGNVSGFGDLEDALTLGARYVAGPALESKLRGRLVVAAKASAAERLSAARSLRAAEDEISQVRLALDLDPEARDLATLTRGWAESLVEARVEIESAERSEAQAAAMLVAAERDLGQMLESYAAGNAHRAERLLRCEGSFQEARALEEMARARAEAARRRARALRAGLELRKQALRAALEARAARLEHDAAWVDGFFAADASR